MKQLVQIFTISAEDLASDLCRFLWQIFVTNRQKSVISIGSYKNPPMELTDFERFVAKICQWKTALLG